MYDAGSQDEAPAPGQVVEVRVQQPVPGTARQGCNIWIIKKSTAIYGRAPPFINLARYNNNKFLLEMD